MKGEETVYSAERTLDGALLTLHHGAVRVGHFLFRVRDYLFPVLFIVLLCTTWPRFPLGSVRVDWWMDLLGIAVATLGQGCRILAVGSANNIRRGGRKKQVSANTLIRSGVFAHSRNPLYLGNVLIFLGLTLIANSYGWYLFALPVVIGIYVTIVLAEEDFLAHQFGAPYSQYCQTVNRFLPTLAGLPSSLADCHFDWQRIVHKEYRIACSWISMTMVLLMWERWKQFGFAAYKIEIEELALVFALLGVVYSGFLWDKSRSKCRTTSDLP